MKAPALARNSISLLIGRLAAQGLGVVLTLILARRLGVEAFGVYALVVSVIFLANVVTTFGTDMVLMREVASGGRVRWQAAVIVQLGLSVLAIALVWVVATLVSRSIPTAEMPLRIFSLSLLPAASYSVCTAVLRGAGRMGAYAALGVAFAAAQVAVVGGVVALAGTSSLGVIVAAALGVQVAIAVLAWIITWLLVPAMRSRGTIEAGDVRDMLRSTGTIGILGLLGMTYQRIPVLLLAAFSGPAAAGWFAGAAKIVEASRTGHLALFGAAYPVMAHARGSVVPDPSLRWAWRVAVGAALAISGFLLVAAAPMVSFLYGDGFGPSVVGLKILALSLVPSTVATYASLELVAHGHEAFSLRAQILSLASLLASFAVLLPALGWIGGCWSVLGAEVVQAAAFLSIRRRVGAETRRSGIAALATGAVR